MGAGVDPHPGLGGAPGAGWASSWDAVIVGAGVGGATLGHALARAGWRVLFCDRGTRRPAGPGLLGEYPEQAEGGAVLGSEDHAALWRAGRCADTLVDASRKRARDFVPFIGSGPGGSSALYGMAMERLQPSDFRPREHHPGASGAALPEAWPISLAELAPYYARAEVLYGVRGERDPLYPPHGDIPNGPGALPAAPALSAAAGELATHLRARGMHPYRLPQACDFVAGCAGCQGFLCARSCKRDAGRVCLEPALRDHGAAYLEGCTATAVRIDGRRATGVVCRHAGVERTLRARVVVLAAGAMFTPLVLLGSRDHRDHPGLGGALVGRHLMRHLIDLYLVRPGERGAGFDNRAKELAFNDFYAGAQGKLGTVQSFGRLPPPEMLHGALRDDAAASGVPGAAAAVALARPLLRPVLRDIAEGWLALASMTEDLPYEGNAVRPAAAGASPRLCYALHTEGHRRIEAFRDAMARVLAGRRWRRLAQAGNNLRIAHACGTCRFGNDPRDSVLDRDNRVHDVDNLFVVDSSFFPSSGGTNPSLTIAANALRVADRLLEGAP